MWKMSSYGLSLCAECGLVGNLAATGGGRLVAFTCCDAKGSILMPCGRCRQLLLEHGGGEMLVDTSSGFKPLSELLPDAFGPDKQRGSAMFDAVSIIGAKRDGRELSGTEIDWIVQAFTQGSSATSRCRRSRWRSISEECHEQRPADGPRR